MKATLSSYRDEYNNVVDDIAVEHSPIDRIVVLRNEDGTMTVRSQRYDGDVSEHTFEPTERMYQGIEAVDGDGGVHPDVAKALFGVGFTVEPQQLEVESETPTESSTDSQSDEEQSADADDEERDEDVEQSQL